MIETLNTILKEGQSTLINNVQYSATKDYLQPFIDRLKPLNPTFRCIVQPAKQLSVTESGPSIIYNRVHIQAILPKNYYYENDCQKVVGMIYGLDIKKPIVKFYIGDIDSNYNLIIFNNNTLNVQEIEEGTALNYSCIQELLEQTDVNKEMLAQLKNVIYTPESLIPLLGEWIDFTLITSYSTLSGKVKLASSVPILVYKALVKDKNSNYYKEENISLYDIYKAFLHTLTEEEDIINTVEKTFLVNKMLGL